MINLIFFLLGSFYSFGNFTEEQIYAQKAEQVMQGRCIACHSCYNAPCQLNLQSYQGFDRGAAKLNVYDGLRIKSVAPSRMFVDADSTSDWRKQGFHSVNNSSKSSENLFLEHLRIRREHPTHKMIRSLESAQICASKMEETKILGLRNPDLGMPFGFPALQDAEFSVMEKWVQAGAPSYEDSDSYREAFKIDKEEIRNWEKFFNKKDLRTQLVSRYIYEHLFLAHIHFENSSRRFYRLVRSQKPCADEVKEIATRRPNDDPGVKQVFYCFKQVNHPVVLKTHIPFFLSQQKMKLWDDLFFKPNWSVKELPTYKPEVAQNPFVAFVDIPAMSRYKFLLDEAQYHVMTFIKGPVCNGTNAVNSIQEQFYGFFLSPETDPMKDSGYETKGMELLMLPGAFGSDVEPVHAPSLMSKMTQHREQYRKLRAQWLLKERPQGLGLNDLWDGDGHNPNAVLTIFRHDDNAVVVKGLSGNLSKTAFVLDYSLFERLVYNLVVNFDVFGNVGHQLLTRVYMDYIRMEAEENFLLFMPPEKRQIYRNSWYQGVFSEAMLKYLFPPVANEAPTSVIYKDSKQIKKQLVEQIYAHLPAEVRGPVDSLNWRNFNSTFVEPNSLSPIEKELKKITAVRSMGSLPFARYMPETSYVLIRKNGKIKDVYSLIRNREFQSISWILAEGVRRAPQEDTLVLRKGYSISYPVMIFDIPEGHEAEFVKQMRGMKSVFDYPTFVQRYGVQANNKNFWQVWDELHAHMYEVDGVRAGHLDLTRYQR